MLCRFFWCHLWAHKTLELCLVINFCLLEERGGETLLQIYVLLLGKGWNTDNFFYLLFFSCFQLKIILMPVWLFWGGIFYPSLVQVAYFLNFERYWQVDLQRVLSIYNSTNYFIQYFVNMQLNTLLIWKELNCKRKCPSMFSFLREVLSTLLKMTRTDET